MAKVPRVPATPFIPDTDRPAELPLDDVHLRFEEAIEKLNPPRVRHACRSALNHLGDSAVVEHEHSKITGAVLGNHTVEGAEPIDRPFCFIRDRIVVDVRDHIAINRADRSIQRLRP